MKKPIFLICLFLLLQNFSFYAQDDFICGTEYSEDPNFDHEAFDTFYQDFLIQQSSESDPIECTKNVVLQFHIIRNDDGEFGLDPAIIPPAFDYVVDYFSELNVNFILADIKYIDNSFYHYLNNDYGTASFLPDTENVPFVVNIYCFETAIGVCGAATSPSGGSDSDRYVFMRNSCMDDTGTLSHELGHYFGLHHTHLFHDSPERQEFVDGTNCAYKGDLLCDTPADPNLGGQVIGNCEYIGTSVDQNGDEYVPQVSNLMSYSVRHCTNEFTMGQIARMSWYLHQRSDIYFPTPDGFRYLGEWQGNQYYHSDHQLSYWEAAAKATSMGGHLAVVNSQAENDFLATNISEDIFIGLSDANTEGNLVWENGDMVSYTNFGNCSSCMGNDEQFDFVTLRHEDKVWSFVDSFSLLNFMVEIPCESNIGFPDLTIGALEADLPSALPGQTVNVSFDLLNIGNKEINQDFTLRVFLSPDNSADHEAIINFDRLVNDIFLTEQVFSNIGIGAIEDVQLSVSIPSYLPPATYYLFVEADYNWEVVEVNEMNNPVSIELEVLPSPYSCIQDITGFTFLTELDNHIYLISNFSEFPEDAIPIAESMNGYVAVINSHEENDLLQKNISDIAYIGLSDAQTEGVFEWVNGEPIVLTNFNFCDDCNENDEEFDYVVLHGWDGGWSFSQSMHPFIVEIPCSQIGSMPDLTLSNPSGLPAMVEVGDQVTVTFDLNNIGTAAVAGDFVTAAYLSTDDTYSSDDIYLAEITQTNTAVGAVEDLQLTFSIPNVSDGNFHVLIIADVNGEVAEFEVLNNSLEIPIVIESEPTTNCPPSLSGFTTLGEFNGSKYFISNGSSTPADAQTVAQQNGGYLAVISSQLENDFLQQHISEMSYIGLNDAQSEGSLVWGNGDAVSYTNFDLCSFCNDNSELDDYVMMHPWNGGWSWSNQFAERKYIIEIPCQSTGGTPDITLSNPTGLPTIAEVGDQVTVTFDLHNIGTEAVTGDYVTAAYLSTDVLFSAGDIYLAQLSQSNTPIGTVENLQLSFSIPNVANGNYYVFIIADVNGDVTELQVLNNGLAIPITVQGGTTTNCPPSLSGFTTLGEFNGSKYFISKGNSTPADAQTVAQQNGGYLAVISSQAENDFLQPYISEMAYIGLNDAQSEGGLIWGNGDAVSYTNFDICSFCNDNSDLDDYVMMHSWNGGWSWSKYYNERKYIVEIPCQSTGGTPDLTLSNPTGLPATAEVGDQVTVTFDLNNIGTEAVTGNYVTAAYLSTDVLFNAGDIYLAQLSQSNTPIGTVENLQLSFSIPNVANGNYYVFIIADVNGDVMELQVLNNGLAIPITVQGGTTTNCPPSLSGFTTLGEFNGSKYFLSNENAQPNDAEVIAQQNGGYLAVISSQEENDFLQQHISEMAYIGLNDAQTEGTFAWVNGEPVTYTNFDICTICNGNYYNYDYVMIHYWNGGWSWNNYSQERKYIVEIPCGATTDNPNMNALIANSFPKTEFANILAIALQKIHPNPSSDLIQVTIQSTLEQKVDLQIFDARGQLMKNIPTALYEGENVHQISIADLAEGVYSIFIPQADGKQRSMRFVKIEN